MGRERRAHVCPNPAVCGRCRMSVDVPGEKPLAEPGGTEKRGGGFLPPSKPPPPPPSPKPQPLPSEKPAEQKK